MEETKDFEISVELREYWRLLLKRKWTIFLFMGACVILVTLYTLKQPKIYRAKTLVLIDRETPSVLSRVKEVVKLGETGFWGQLQYLNTQMKIIKSRHIAGKVVDYLNLEDSPDFSGPDPIGTLLGMIDVKLIKDSRLVEIDVENKKPEMAQKLANAVAEEYRKANLERKTKATDDATKWLAVQLDNMLVKLKESEIALYKFKQEHNIVTTSLEDKVTMISRKLDAVSEELTKAESKRRVLEIRYEQLRNLAESKNIQTLAQVLTSPLIEKLRETEAELSKEREGLLKRYKEKHPAVQEVDAKLETVREKILKEVQDVILSVQSDLEAAKETEKKIRQTLQKTKNEALTLSKYEIDYGRLKREADNYQRLYKLLLQRQKESDLTRLLHVNNISIIDKAELPKNPVKPRVGLNILLAFIIGLLGGVGLAFLMEHLDNTLKSQEDVENVVGLPFLGLVPSIKNVNKGNKHLPGKVDLYVHEHPKSSMAECARTIRTSLLFTTQGKSPLKLLVTSAGPQEGKTLIATTLSVTMAQAGNDTVLIDTDMRRPRVHKIFEMETGSKGLSAALVGECSLDEAIMKTPVSNLDIIPCGPIPPNPAELIGSEAFRELVRKLEGRYQRLVFDSPPVVAVTDAMVLSDVVDGVVLVLKSGRTTRELAKQAKKQLDDVDAKLLGCVMNDVDLDSRDYGYYHYYYYHKYGYYYGDKSGEKADTGTEA
ncbi:MAG: polysaccharide biosynthesis tyrosine autokinase [Deltaproteobacteria bacterium]|nr:polysaccharide biosynthesis tyrosine autokinase [Deltaproteobacteria bacterium]